ncbi:hypothetical protein Tco_0514306 [Tanacetum coccineum]
MSTLNFADTHNMIAFLEKPAESEGFEQIVDFLNANPIKYALTVNPTIFVSCIEQFWTTGVVKKFNGEPQIHAIIDGKKQHYGIRNNLSSYQPTVQFLKVYLGSQVEGLPSHKRKYIAPCHTKKSFGNMKKANKDLLGNVTPLFPTMVSQPSELVIDINKAVIVERVTKQSNDLLSGEDSLKLEELMVLCTTLQSRVIALEETKTTQAAEITSLKKRAKKLEKGKKLRNHKLKRLYKVGLTARVDSSDEEQSLGKDASKQGRKINDIDADIDVTLVNDAVNDDEMFDVDVQNNEEINVAE